MKVAIAWYGAEGQSSYKYFVARGDDVTIVTPRVSPQYPIPEGAQAIIGDDAFDRLGEFELVVRSAGLRPDSIVTSGTVWSNTNEFFAQCPAPIIGVTGTKGKGTTSSLIAEILRASGQTVHLVGNIGVAPLDALADIVPTDVVVFELSSFQLWDLDRSPQVAVVLMIEPDHLDVHHSMEEYVAAKARIALHQSSDDLTLYHPTNPYSAQAASAGLGRKVRYAVVDDGQVYVKSNTFFVQDTAICSVDALQLPGQHNVENACAAISAALAGGAAIEAVETGLRAFHGLPHRLKLVAEKNGVKYYDDSIATTPGSAIAALEAFTQPKIILLGGSDKGAVYDDIVRHCSETGSRVIAIGQTGGVIAELCARLDVPCRRVEGLMDMAVAAAAELADPGDVVILSPASASFDQYASYSDRGDQFVAAVEAL